MSAAIVDPRSNLCDIVVSGTYDASATTVLLDPEDVRIASLATAPYYMLWWNSTDYPAGARDPYAEYVRVTGITDNSLTVTRAQLGTAASAKNLAGKTYRLARVWQAEDIAAIENRIWQQGYSVKDFGAVGDGVTDDTTALQDALDAADAAGGGLVLLPVGTYLTTAALDLYSFVTLRGMGANLSIIKNTTTNALQRDSGETILDGATLEGFAVQGPNSGADSLVAFAISKAQRCRIWDCAAIELNTGLQLDDACYFNDVRRFYAYRCETGVELTNHTNKSNRNHFDHLIIRDSGLWSGGNGIICNGRAQYFGSVYATLPGGNSALKWGSTSNGGTFVAVLYAESTLTYAIDNDNIPSEPCVIAQVHIDGAATLLQDAADVKTLVFNSGWNHQVFKNLEPEIELESTQTPSGRKWRIISGGNVVIGPGDFAIRDQTGGTTRVNIDGATGKLDYTGDADFSGILETSGRLRIPVLSAEPSTPAAGDVVAADRSTWDPLSIGSGGPYVVWYTGSAWAAMGDQ